MEGSDTIDEGKTIVSKDTATGKVIEIETGVGWNPDAGLIERYEEVWSEEALVSGQRYAFLTNDEDPHKSDAFLSIVGPHALALSQTDGQPFHAIRMTKSSSPSSRSHHGWKVIHSTPPPASLDSNNLDVALCNFLTLLNDKESSSTVGFWTRGDRISLEWERAPRDWTVFDCGIIA
jgi:hypothetical protein